MNLAALQKKVAKIKELDPKSKVYRFYRVTHVQYIENFEEKFKIRLPEDFREFLINIASGIEERGFNPCSVMDDIKFWEHSLTENQNNPSKKFQLTTRITAFADELNFADFYPYPSNVRYFEHDAFTNGIIPILNTGCGAYDFIVVNGPEHGNIWSNNYMSNSDLFPRFNKKFSLNRISFEFWINQQLDDAIRYLSG